MRPGSRSAHAPRLAHQQAMTLKSLPLSSRRPTKMPFPRRFSSARSTPSLALVATNCQAPPSTQERIRENSSTTTSSTKPFSTTSTPLEDLPSALPSTVFSDEEEMVDVYFTYPSVALSYQAVLDKRLSCQPTCLPPLMKMRFLYTLAFLLARHSLTGFWGFGEIGRASCRERV